MNVNEVKFDVGPLDHAKAEAKPLEIKSYSLGMKCRFCSQICHRHCRKRKWCTHPISDMDVQYAYTRPHIVFSREKLSSIKFQKLFSFEIVLVSSLPTLESTVLTLAWRSLLDSPPILLPCHFLPFSFVIFFIICYMYKVRSVLLFWSLCM